MPMSTDAMAGLKSAVAWNPEAARYLLGILREAPACVKCKPDPYGPLHMMLNPGAHERRVAEGITVSVNPPPFPEDMRPAFETFGREWRQRQFSKGELAETIERMLDELDEASRQLPQPALADAGYIREGEMIVFRPRRNR